MKSKKTNDGTFSREVQVATEPEEIKAAFSRLLQSPEDQLNKALVTIEAAAKERGYKKILDKLHYLKETISKGNTADIVLHSLDFGAEVMKSDLNELLIGRLQPDNRKGNHEAWQAEAEKIWQNKPHLSHSATARLIKNRLKVQEEEQAIRKAIKKPT